MSGERRHLYVQILISLGLLALTALVAAVPAGPLGRVREALTWTVFHDYDFAGKVRQTGRWARGQGGWTAAAGNLVTAARTRVQSWAGPLMPRDRTPAAALPPAPAPQAGPPEGPSPAPSAPEPAETASPNTIMPVDGTIMYGFGWLPKGRQVHEGLDLAAAEGAPVMAIADGTVTRVRTDEVLGMLVEVDHGFVIALYGQVRDVKVKAADRVKQGQRLATVARPTGKEGDSGAHLHFEVRPHQTGKTVDPTPYLPVGRALQGGNGI
ncbi:MAG TPA: M23 family metallopeptidase [Symbiobacteriaceae bacterium]|nr:M23 family metallopeptidase [Symbiobacteriaceae bacterium]